MKFFTYILTVIALGFVIYNLTLIDYNSPFEGDSKTVVITVIAGLCAIMILAIIRISRRIDETVRRRGKSTPSK